MNLLELASYGKRRGVKIISDDPEARLVLFSLQQGQKVQGTGEPRVHLVVLDGQGELWSGEQRVTAQAGSCLPAEPGQLHGAQAREGRFLVLGIINPQGSRRYRRASTRRRNFAGRRWTRGRSGGRRSVARTAVNGQEHRRLPLLPAYPRKRSGQDNRDLPESSSSAQIGPLI